MRKAYTKPSLGKVRLVTEEAVLANCKTHPHFNGTNGPGSQFADCADTTGALTPCFIPGT